MPPSLRFAHPTSSTPQTTPSTSLTPTVSSNEPISYAENPSVATSRNLRFNARVPMAGMQNSTYSSDASRSNIHLTTTKSIDLEAVDKLEFDDIAVREYDIPPDPDDEDELPLQSSHNRSPSPPLFRDFDLPTLDTRRPEEITTPSNLLGTIPDDTVGSDQLPFHEVSSLGLGRRIPSRTEALSIHPGRNTDGNRPPS